MAKLKTRHKYPIMGKFGRLEAWYYGDRKLYVYLKGQVQNATGELTRGQAKRLLAFLKKAKP